MRIEYEFEGISKVDGAPCRGCGSAVSISEGLRTLLEYYDDVVMLDPVTGVVLGAA